MAGTATASKGRCSVKQDDIAPRAVTNTKLKAKAVSAGKIRRNAVRSGHIADNAVGLVAIQAKATMRATGNNAARAFVYEAASVPNPSMIMRSGSTEFQARYSVPGPAPRTRTRA